MKKKLDCVLLVDDDEMTNFINQTVIERADVANKIDVALDGQEALEYLTCSGKYSGTAKYPQPDLVFLDINMPRMTGWEFLEEYKNLEADQRANVVVIMLTTSVNPDDGTRAKSTAEVADFRQKPLNNDMLMEILQQHFPYNF